MKCQPTEQEIDKLVDLVALSNNRLEAHPEVVRDGESCEVEPRLKMRQFAS